MQPDDAQRLELDRQVTLARPLLLALVLVAMLTEKAGDSSHWAILFVGAYLALAMALLLLDRSGQASHMRLPVAVDVAALAVFFSLSPSIPGFWFFYLFVSFAAAASKNPRVALALGAIAVAAVVIRTGRSGTLDAPGLFRLAMVGVGTLAVGAASGYLGARERRHAMEDRFLKQLVGLLQVERGLAESIRMALDEVAREFASDRALIAARDDELERVFVWKTRQGQREPIAPETFPHARADAFLADDLETSICWNSFEGAGDGFGWKRGDGKPLGELPRLPAEARQALDARSLLAATLDSATKPMARLILLNGRRRFTPRDLRWLEQIAHHLGPPLENLFQLRHLRARAVEADRSRISRDLHDGILQTLLSVIIRVDVLRRKLPGAPEQAEAELTALQRIIQEESDELRRMVTDLRPQHVESADLVELMNGFAERFRLESQLAIDLFLEGRDLRVPDRVCRELFQIYRESLHNIKKHARAGHVVVKLWQDETKVFLVVDDNGQGFSFAGRYTSEELDRLRLGPISIKERTRSVGGMLTVESTPGHGARLTIEIPLS